MNYVIVPYGISIKDNKIEPSFLYKYSLDKIISLAKKKDFIYLAPANHFGTNSSEQKVAYEYLKNKTKANIIYFETKNKKYLNTFDNFFELKKFLIKKKNWPIKCTVITFYLTKQRVIFSLKKNQYKNFVILEIKKKFQLNLNDQIVSRLFIYKYNFLHKIYEFISYLIFKIKY